MARKRSFGNTVLSFRYCPRLRQWSRPQQSGSATLGPPEDCSGAGFIHSSVFIWSYLRMLTWASATLPSSVSGHFCPACLPRTPIHSLTQPGLLAALLPFSTVPASRPHKPMFLQHTEHWPLVGCHGNTNKKQDTSLTDPKQKSNL